MYTFKLLCSCNVIWNGFVLVIEWFVYPWNLFQCIDPFCVFSGLMYWFVWISLKVFIVFMALPGVTICKCWFYLVLGRSPSSPIIHTHPNSSHSGLSRFYFFSGSMVWNHSEFAKLNLWFKWIDVIFFTEPTMCRQQIQATLSK